MLLTHYLITQKWIVKVFKVHLACTFKPLALSEPSYGGTALDDLAETLQEIGFPPEFPSDGTPTEFMKINSVFLG